MNDPAILFIKPKTISAEDKKILRDAGVFVVEIKDPQDAKFTRAYADLSGSEMLVAAGAAILQSDIARKAFGESIAKALALKKLPER